MTNQLIKTEIEKKRGKGKHDMREIPIILQGKYKILPNPEEIYKCKHY